MAEGKPFPSDGVEAAGQALADAWDRYHKFFDDVPHGTQRQMSCLLELAGGEDFLIRIGKAAEVAKMARGMRGLAKKQKRRVDRTAKT